MTKSYQDLNAEMFLAQDGKLNLEADKEAVRRYFLDVVNKHTRYFLSLEDKVEYLVFNELWAPEVETTYGLDGLKTLMRQAYAKNFRFQSLLGAQKAYTSYILRDLDGETFVERWEDRIVLCAVTYSQGDFRLAQDLVDVLMGGYATLATPTLINAGRARGGKPVSCFLLDVQDNMESIARTVTNALQLSKGGGGVGINLTNLRAQGDPIKAIPNASSGVIPVMKMLENAFQYSNQSGARDGAGVTWLSAHHPDIMRFLDTRRENADAAVRIKTLSIGVVVPDITYHLAKRNAQMALFSPYDVERVEGKPFAECDITERYDAWVDDDRIQKDYINARKFFQTMSSLQQEAGYPYVMHVDTVNREHTMKHAGKVTLSNLCVEITQLSRPSTFNEDGSYQHIGHDISCNLASLNVDRMLTLDPDAFDDTVRVMVRALSNVSDSSNVETVPSVKNGNEASHAIGLGQMSLHAALATRGMEYGSPEALRLWDRYMARVTWAAMSESAKLAGERGSHKWFDGSEYDTGEWYSRVLAPWREEVGDDRHIHGTLSAPSDDEWEWLKLEISQYGMYNAYLQAIAPNGSIAYLNHATSSIHPVVYPLETRKEGKVGRVYYAQPGLTNNNIHLYKDAYKIGWEKTIDTCAVSQRWVDQSQSMTLFFTDEANSRDLDRARIYAWIKGIKTVYYIRTRQDAMSGTAVSGTAIDVCESCMI
ncbi:class 1b ribonucleoside-diphosphate reductase subunit alpha [Corynebacterium glyciniphilum]|uniref:class 1b ribonucleoside-diphosphate reductase subunit alpha n=1 Tax=Corynebacterium glyciniphilum TaxID=1404244 RepID=UPI003FD3C062